MLAALVGIDHQLALSARVLDRFTATQNGSHPTPFSPPRAGEGAMRSRGGKGSPIPGEVASLSRPLADARLTRPRGGGEVRTRTGIGFAGGPHHPRARRPRRRREGSHRENLRGQPGPSGALRRHSCSGPSGRPRCCRFCRRAFDPELLAAVDYLGLLVIRGSALDPPPACPTDAALRIAERYGSAAIGHLPAILSIRGDRIGDSGGLGSGGGQAASKPSAAISTARAIGNPGSRPAPDGTIGIRHPLPAEPPLASIIVPDPRPPRPPVPLSR